MAKKPAIPHETIVQYILGGHTTREAKAHFGFASDNVAHLRVHAAFKRLGIVRPRYRSETTCDYCGKQFIARDREQRTCGARVCQGSLIRDWQRKHPEKIRKAHARYRKTPKGRASNRRVHQRKGDRLKTGTAVERWQSSLEFSTHRLRKLRHLVERNPWVYRIEHLQKACGRRRERNPRPERGVSRANAVKGNTRASGRWQYAIRAIQTTLIHDADHAHRSVWEARINALGGALRMGHNVRLWQKKSPK